MCYSTKVPTNSNLEFYIGKLVQVDPSLFLPKDHKVKGKTNEICLPYADYFANPEDEDTFKMLSELELRNMGSGYTCFVKSFMFFTADREIKIAKNPLISFFDSINTVDKFEALGLPIKKKTSCPDGTQNVAYEIDLS